MFVKVENQKLVYPYTLRQFKLDHPQISFSKITDAILAKYNVFPVIDEKPEFDKMTEKLVQTDILKTEKGWEVQYVIEQLPQTQKDKLLNDLKHSVRLERNNKLLKSDWFVLKAMEKGNAVLQDVEEYRQALRDVPQQPDFPHNVAWPELPDELK